jgi:hypothetical protein
MRTYFSLGIFIVNKHDAVLIIFEKHMWPSARLYKMTYKLYKSLAPCQDIYHVNNQ